MLRHPDSSWILQTGSGSDRLTLEHIVDGLQSVVEVRGGGHAGAGGAQPGQIVLTQQTLQQLQQLQQHVDPTTGFTLTLQAPHTTLSSGPVVSASTVSSSSILGQQHGYTYSTAGLRLGDSSVPLTTSLAGSLPAAFAGSLPPGLQGLASTLASSLSLQAIPLAQQQNQPINQGQGHGQNPNPTPGQVSTTSGPGGCPSQAQATNHVQAQGQAHQASQQGLITLGPHNIQVGSSGIVVGGPGISVGSHLPQSTTSSLSSPGSPFSLPTRSPAPPHAPPTPSPSPGVLLRSPATPLLPPSCSSPAPSPYQSRQSPQYQGTQTTGSTNNGTISVGVPPPSLTPVPSPSPQSRAAPSPSAPQHTAVIHQAVTSQAQMVSSQVSALGQTVLPMVAQGPTQQLVQIIQQQQQSALASGTNTIATFSAGRTTQIISNPASNVMTVPIQAALKATKQHPQILPKPPATPGSAGSTAKNRSSANTSTNVGPTQLQPPPTAQLVIGQSNQSTATAMIPSAPAGTLLFNSMMGGLTSGAPMIVQQQSSGMQLILRPQGSAGTQAQVQATQHTTQTQVQQSKSVVLGNGSGLGAAGTVYIAHPAQASRQAPVFRIITTPGPPMLQQIQSGPTLFLPQGLGSLSFPMAQLSAGSPQQATQSAQLIAQPSFTQQTQTIQQKVVSLPSHVPVSLASLQQQQNISTSLANQLPASIASQIGALPVNVAVSQNQQLSTLQAPVSVSQANLHIPVSMATLTAQAQLQNQEKLVNQLTSNVLDCGSGFATLTTPRVQLCPVSSANSTVTSSWQNVINSPPPVQEQQLSSSGSASVTTQQTLLSTQPRTPLPHTQPHPPVHPTPKPKKKKSKKKKKDEEPKLDLANIMKLSGIGDEDDIGPYETEDPSAAANLGVASGVEVQPAATPVAPVGPAPAPSPPPEPFNLQGLKLVVNEDGRVSLLQQLTDGTTAPITAQSLTSANAQVLLQSLAAQAAQPGGQYASTIAAAAHSQLVQLLSSSSSQNKQNTVFATHQIHAPVAPAGKINSNQPPQVTSTVGNVSRLISSGGLVSIAGIPQNQVLSQAIKSQTPLLSSSVTSIQQPSLPLLTQPSTIPPQVSASPSAVVGVQPTVTSALPLQPTAPQLPPSSQSSHASDQLAQPSTVPNTTSLSSSLDAKPSPTPGVSPALEKAFLQYLQNAGLNTESIVITQQNGMPAVVKGAQLLQLLQQAQAQAQAQEQQMQLQQQQQQLHQQQQLQLQQLQQLQQQQLQHQLQQQQFQQQLQQQQQLQVQQQIPQLQLQSLVSQAQSQTQTSSQSQTTTHQILQTLQPTSVQLQSSQILSQKLTAVHQWDTAKISESSDLAAAVALQQPGKVGVTVSSSAGVGAPTTSTSTIVIGTNCDPMPAKGTITVKTASQTPVLPARRNSAEPNASPRVQVPPFQSPQIQMTTQCQPTSLPQLSAPSSTQNQMEQVLNNAFLDSLAQSRPNLLINKSISKPSSNVNVDVVPSINVTPSNRKSKKRKQPPKVSVTVQPQGPVSQPTPGQSTSITSSLLQTTRLASPLVNHKVVNESSAKAMNIVGPVSTSTSSISAETSRTTTLPSFFVSPNFTVVPKNSNTALVGMNVNNGAPAQLPQVSSSLPSITPSVTPSQTTSQISVVSNSAVKTVSPSESVNFVTSVNPRVNHVNSSGPTNSSVNCPRVNSTSASSVGGSAVPSNLIPIPANSPSSLGTSVLQPLQAPQVQVPVTTQQLPQQPLQRVQAIQLTAAKNQQFKAVQQQLNLLHSKKVKTAADESQIQKLIAEQQKIINSGKLLSDPTVVAQVMQSVGSSVESALEGASVSSTNHINANSSKGSVNTSLPVSVSQATTAVGSTAPTTTTSVRYYHQVGNQVITLTPQQQQQPPPPLPTPQQQQQQPPPQPTPLLPTQLQPPQPQQQAPLPPSLPRTSQLPQEQQQQPQPTLQLQFKSNKLEQPRTQLEQSQRVQPELPSDTAKQQSYPAQQSFQNSQQHFNQFPQDIESQVQSCINSLDNSFLDLQAEPQIVQHLQQSPASPLNQMSQPKLLSPCQPSQSSPILPVHQGSQPTSSHHLAVAPLQVHQQGMSMPTLHSPQLPSAQLQQSLTSPQPQQSSQSAPSQLSKPQGLLLAQPTSSQHPSAPPVLRPDSADSDKGSPTFGQSTLCDGTQFQSSGPSCERGTSPIHVVLNTPDSTTSPPQSVTFSPHFRPLSVSVGYLKTGSRSVVSPKLPVLHSPASICAPSPASAISTQSPTSISTQSPALSSFSCPGTMDPILISPPLLPLRTRVSSKVMIEQQMKEDQESAKLPDTHSPFMNKSDAVQRLMSYHVFNEKLLSQQDLEKADEIHEHTAQHLLDKFANITNKFRSLILAESMREVRLAEVVMIDRLRNAEEEALTKAAKQAKDEEEAAYAAEVAEVKAAEEAAHQAAKVEEAVAAEVAEAVATVADGAVVSINDVEADLCGVKSELRSEILDEIAGDSPNLQDEVRIAKTEALKLEAIKCEKTGDGNEEYNEWEAIKQELGYRPPETNDDSNHVASGHYGDWELGPFCPPKVEEETPDRVKIHQKRCTVVNGDMDDFLCPKKKLRIYDEIDELGDTDLSAQVQSAIDSIINLQLPQLPSSPEFLASLNDHEDDSTSLIYSSSMPAQGPPHVHSQSNSLGSSNNPHNVPNSHTPSSASNTDSALDEAVRSILTS